MGAPDNEHTGAECQEASRRQHRGANQPGAWAHNLVIKNGNTEDSTWKEKKHVHQDQKGVVID